MAFKKMNKITERTTSSIKLFQDAARRVPAYKDFLKKNKINPSNVLSQKDFEQVPSIDKNNYLRKYPLKDLCWDGFLDKPLVFTSTSGSTGKPFYFARTEEIDLQSATIYESFLKQNVLKNGGTTLIVICFGMGVWIGGLIAYESLRMSSCKNSYPISILTPGINKKEIFEALRELAPNFDQVVLIGYPPFIKDVMDESSRMDINIKEMNIKLIFAAEIFTEKFRDYVAKKAGIKNIYLDIMHIYGSADIGTMAWETGVSTLVKRLADQDKVLFSALFPDLKNKMPTFAQYNPQFINFEAQAGEILLTGNNVVPLVRYSIGDRGGVMSYAEVGRIFKENGYDLDKEIKKVSLAGHVEKLPFVYVYERIDFATTIYGLQIFPEMIRDSLLHKDVAEFLTGKFTLLTKFDNKQNQYLEINVELKSDAKPDSGFKRMVADRITSDLSKKSSEFRELHAYLKERAVPKLVFWNFNDPTYFKAGIKQKWVA